MAASQSGRAPVCLVASDSWSRTFASGLANAGTRFSSKAHIGDAQLIGAGSSATNSAAGTRPRPECARLAPELSEAKVSQKVRKGLHVKYVHRSPSLGKVAKTAGGSDAKGIILSSLRKRLPEVVRKPV